MLQLAQRFRLDLADALARHRELLAEELGVSADCSEPAAEQPERTAASVPSVTVARDRSANFNTLGGTSPILPDGRTQYLWMI